MKRLIFILGLMVTMMFAQTYKFQNPDLPVDERVDDLVSHMTLQEKADQLIYKAPAIERLGVPAYNWWNECLHGVARAGIATVFPQAIGMAATWDTSLIYDVATVISDEARAKHNEFLRQGKRDIYEGLTFWSPNINIFRDPRWGRGQETYGEDPYLTSRIGVAFVKGLQGDNPKYLKVVATPKHFAVHSGPEAERHRFDAQTDERDLRETYLPAFYATIVEAGANSVMSAYNRYNGEAASASQTLLVNILRGEWTFSGYVTSDCGAIRDIWEFHKMVKTPAQAAALALKHGCDLNCGDTYKHLREALDQGLITEDLIDKSVKRLFKARFELGMFDPADRVPYAQIPYSENDSPAHDSLALRTARESLVLLKNDGVLPFGKNIKSIAVVGPNADDLDVLEGNYNGRPSHPVTILQGLRARFEDSSAVYYAKGCDLYESKEFTLGAIPAKYLKTSDQRDAATGLKGEYFTNTHLEGEPVITRIDPNVDFDWGLGSPDTKIPNDGFSARWTGVLMPDESGLYRLGTCTDDGTRLYVDDSLIVDEWKGQSSLTYSKEMKLEAGKTYKIRFEYFEGGVSAVAQLGWLKPGYKNEIKRKKQTAFDDAVAAAKQSDAVVFVGGISPLLEGEERQIDVNGFFGGDRTNLKLPASQEKLLKALREAGKPVVLVLTSGSALAVNWEQENLNAILQAWYPGQRGGTAVADVLFGDYNPAGRLPVTFYKSVDDLPPFEDYNMKGHTYRYFDGPVLYPFGYGLSYSTFEYSALTVSSHTFNDRDEIKLSVKVKNTSARTGDEVVQVYIKDLKASVPVPIKTLKSFKRIHFKAGEDKTIKFTLKSDDFGLYDKEFKRVVEPGKFEIVVGSSSSSGLKTTVEKI